MKFRLYLLSVSLLLSCAEPEKKMDGQSLARKNCSSCHQFPDPSLLNKESWKNGVLPQMKFRMGLDYFKINTVPAEDKATVYSILPGEGMVSDDEWNLIQEYYLQQAPDSLTLPEIDIPVRAPFGVKEFILPSLEVPLITLLKKDATKKLIYVGTRANKLYQFNYDLRIQDSLILASPPSAMILNPDGDGHLFSLMGIMDPNDRARGEIGSAILQRDNFTSIVDSLRRPVHFEYSDLDSDGVAEFIVAEFGNYTGALTIYKQESVGAYSRHVLDYAPGARRIIIKDVNNDNRPDIIALMTQGDERIILFENAGNLKFKPKTLLRFPPVYGASDFDIADFNKDGNFDIILTNGDNADFSSTLKPYHGVRIFLNDGKQSFIEDWFFPMYGAFRALPYDFDNDGDLDIAAIAFFPDFKNGRERGFMYFENTDAGFVPKIIPESANARWLVMELADLDQDGKMDIILGALDFPSGVPSENYDYWKKKRTGLMILTNQYP
jgi:hypothetical protein